MDDTLNDLIEQARRTADAMQVEIDAAIDRHGAMQVEIDAAIDRHGALRRFIDDMTGGETETPDVTPPDTPAAPKDRSASVRAAATRRATCPDCGKECSATGIGTHRARAHGYRKGDATRSTPTPAPAPVKVWPAADAPPKPKPAPTPAPSPVVATIVDHLVSGTGNKPMIARRPHVLACTEDDCDAEFAVDEMHRLRRHCLDEHGRVPRSHERSPVVAAGPVAGAA